MRPTVLMMAYILPELVPKHYSNEKAIPKAPPKSRGHLFFFFSRATELDQKLTVAIFLLDDATVCQGWTVHL